jgi:hypothetical protein
MSNEQTVREINLSLDVFLQAANAENAEEALAFLIEKQVEPLVKKILRGKFHASLRIDDERLSNQDALELTSEIKALILSKLRDLKAENNGNCIENFEAYVNTTTINAYRQYLRAKYPLRLQLKNKLRYLLTHRREFSLWQSGENLWLCGFENWKKRDFNSANNNSSPEYKTALIDSLRENFKQHTDLASQISEVFDYCQNPIPFADLVAVIGDLHGIKEPLEISDAEASAENSAARETKIDLQMEQAAFLKLLWREICELPLRHRLVLLLNLKEGGESLIALLPLLRVASIRQIAEKLEIEAVDFARIWNELPWDDARIAGYLNITRQQVINLRQSARAALRRRLKNF